MIGRMRLSTTSPVVRSLAAASTISGRRASAAIHTTSVTQLPMKPGTPIPGLDFMKDRDPPVALERSEYPDWINHLTTQKSLAQLRRLPEEEATDHEKKRYLKLTRRVLIKQKNEEAAGSARK